MPTVLLLVVAGLAGRPDAPQDQTLVVTTASWKADRGRAVLVEVGVGWKKLIWGRGAHPSTKRPGPVKAEGDGRAPAGVFKIGPTWWRVWGQRTWCVDDAKSAQYGRIVTLKPDAKRAFESAEWMADYRVAVVVEHNPDNVKGGGSCIFLHDGTEPTVGCTAFEPKTVNALVSRLRGGARIVQLPAAEYKALATDWKLPPPALVGLK